MDASHSMLYGVDKDRPNCDVVGALQDADGAMVGNYQIHTRKASDGSLCAQFELRSSDNFSIDLPAFSGLVASRHENRWPGLLVEMAYERQKPYLVRLRIDIPGQTPRTSVDTRNDQTPIAIRSAVVGTIETVLQRCRDTEYRDAAIHLVVAYRRMRELENDRGITKLESLATLIYEP